MRAAAGMEEEEGEEEGGEDEALAANCDVVTTGMEVMERSVLQPLPLQTGAARLSQSGALQ